MTSTSPRGEAPAQTRPRNLAAGPSIILDAVRFLAALTVAVGHVSQSYFTTGWPPILMNFAEGAVSVFFVLSGFMIRYITRFKYGDVRQYTVDRAARIYSVALPALGLTIVFDTLSSHFNHAYYQLNFGEPPRPAWSHLFLIGNLLAQNWVRGLGRVALSLAMLSQSWFRNSSPLSNSPFWSLSYECVYYALFGIAVYFKGARRIVGWLIVFLLIGPTVFLMFPLWLLGCAAYDAYEDGALKPGSLGKLALTSLLSVAGVHGGRALVGHFHAQWFFLVRVVSYMDFVAIATAAILVPVCIAARNWRVSEGNLAVRGIRAAAAATFPLYLTHFPLFVLFAATVPYPHARVWAKLVLLGTALGLSLVLSGPCDQLKDYWRRRFLRPRGA